MADVMPRYIEDTQTVTHNVTNSGGTMKHTATATVINNAQVVTGSHYTTGTPSGLYTYKQNKLQWQVITNGYRSFAEGWFYYGNNTLVARDNIDFQYE